ncbi:MAG: radical SAM protein [Nitrospira sp.]|nr:radical SAM protein [Nitrospira sp.]
MTALRTLYAPVRNLLRGRPLLAVFQVCLRCNSNCGYCNLPLNQGRYEMTRGEIRRVFTGLYRDGVRAVFLQGGEPLLRRDLPEILEDLAGLGFFITLITNGTKFTRPLLTRLARHRVMISVSLDTLDRERYCQIRGADQFDQVCEGIALLREYPHQKCLVCIVSELNRAEVPSVVRFATEQGFLPVVGAYHWEVGLYGKKDLLLMYERQQAGMLFQQLLDEALIPPGSLKRFTEDNVRWLQGRDLEPCDAGRYSIAIDASGNVSPCLSLPPSGNLLKASLREILAGFDRDAIAACSGQSSCNRLDSRIVGSVVRHPFTALRTPVTL